MAAGGVQFVHTVELMQGFDEGKAYFAVYGFGGGTTVTGTDTETSNWSIGVETEPKSSNSE